jgi:diacylglycerol kinase (ATP)
MCNYFSIGIESRIGLGFDKQRTSSAICNKICYGWEGIKKMCCVGKTKKIKDVIDYVSTVDPESGNERIIFATDKATPSEHYLHGNPVSFVCTNINSMMGG